MKKIKEFGMSIKIRLTDGRLICNYAGKRKLRDVDLVVVCDIVNTSQIDELISTLNTIRKGFNLPDTYIEM